MADPQKPFFEGDYQLAYADYLRSVDTEQQADRIAEVLGLTPGARVLDTVCGHGRHVLALARRGYRVAGCDLSEVEVARARAAASEAGLEVDVRRADMRDLPFEAAFDCACNVFTAFGYFEDPAEDLRALASFRRALVPGGRFFLDTLHAAWIHQHFQPRSWSVTDAGVLVLRTRRLDLRAGALWEGVEVREPGKAPRRHEVFVRLYTADRLVTALESCGLRVEALYGSWEGEPLGLRSHRLMAVCEAV